MATAAVAAAPADPALLLQQVAEGRRCATCMMPLVADLPPMAALLGLRDHRPRRLPSCQHVFCSHCVSLLVAHDRRCPSCQTPFQADSIEQLPIDETRVAHLRAIDTALQQQQQIQQMMQQQFQQQQQQQQQHPAQGTPMAVTVAPTLATVVAANSSDAVAAPAAAASPSFLARATPQKAAAGAELHLNDEDLPDAAVIGNRGADAMAASGMPALDPPLNTRDNSDDDEEDEDDEPVVGALAGSGAAGGRAFSTPLAAGGSAAAGGYGGGGMGGGGVGVPMFPKLGGYRARRHEAMTPQRKLVEVAALEEIGFAHAPIGEDDFSGLREPHYHAQLGLLKQHLSKMNMVSPELRKKQTVKNEFTGASLVQSLHSIFACVCGCIKYGQKQKALNHIINKHGPKAREKNQRQAHLQQLQAAAAAAGGGAGAGGGGGQPSDNFPTTVALLPSEIERWTQELLQGGEVAEAAAAAGPSTSLAGPNFANIVIAPPAATAGNTNAAAGTAAAPIPLIAPSALDASAPPPIAKAEPVYAADFQPTDTRDSVLTVHLNQPNGDNAAVATDATAAAAAATRAAGREEADDTEWLARGFESTTINAADDLKNVAQSWRAQLFQEWLTKMHCVDLNKLASVEPSAVNSHLAEATVVYGCKCRGIRWGERSEAFAHILEEHGGGEAAAAAREAGPDPAACANCNAVPDELMQCSACLSVCYCSGDCQKTHWKTHKTDCKRIQSERAGGGATAGSTPAATGGAGMTGLFAGATPSRSYGSSARGKRELLTLVNDLGESQRCMQAHMVRMAKELTQWREEAQRLHKLNQVAASSDFVDLAAGESNASAAAAAAVPAAAGGDAPPQERVQAGAPEAAEPSVKLEPSSGGGGGEPGAAEGGADASAASEAHSLRASNARLRSELSFLRSSHQSLERRLAEWESTFGGALLPAQALRMQQDARRAEQGEELRRNVMQELQPKLRRAIDAVFAAEEITAAHRAASAARTMTWGRSAAVPAVAATPAAPVAAAVVYPYAFAPAAAVVPSQQLASNVPMEEEKAGQSTPPAASAMASTTPAATATAAALTTPAKRSWAAAAPPTATATEGDADEEAQMEGQPQHSDEEGAAAAKRARMET